MSIGRIARGDVYPLAIADGVFIDLFLHSASTLRIGMPNISDAEAEDYRAGQLKFGLVYKDGAILTLWKFGGQPWIDAHFDAVLAHRLGRLEIPTLTAESRMLIDLHLVDTSTKIVKGLRAFTLSVKQTAIALSAVKRQLKDGMSSDALTSLLSLPTDELVDGNEITG